MAEEAHREAGKMKLFRIYKHLFLSRWLVRFYFSKKDLVKIAEHIAHSESKHRAEIRVAIESKLDILQVIRNVKARQRAIDTFSQLGIWDTEENSGVLIYLLLVDHQLEIVADRGIHKVLGHDYWEKINQKVVEHFKQKRYTEGILYAIDEINTKMIEIFPKQGEDPDELSNEVVIL